MDQWCMTMDRVIPMCWPCYARRHNKLKQYIYILHVHCTCIGLTTYTYVHVMYRYILRMYKYTSTEYSSPWVHDNSHTLPVCIQLQGAFPAILILTKVYTYTGIYIIWSAKWFVLVSLLKKIHDQIQTSVTYNDIIIQSMFYMLTLLVLYHKLFRNMTKTILAVELSMFHSETWGKTSDFIVGGNVSHRLYFLNGWKIFKNIHTNLSSKHDHIW